MAWRTCAIALLCTALSCALADEMPGYAFTELCQNQSAPPHGPQSGSRVAQQLARRVQCAHPLSIWASRHGRLAKLDDFGKLH
ncbi:hypothetical protein MRX96_012048 [Rhipicephalus microplus]